MNDCPKCGADIDPETFPFGDDVVCPKCGAAFETDWEYTGGPGDDSYGMEWWIVEEKPAP